MTVETQSKELDMAEARVQPHLSGKHVVIRIENQVFVIPSERLNEFRNADFEKQSPGEIEAFFRSHREPKVEAANVRTVIILNGDRAPDPSEKKR